jgi:hypothetical protein
VALLSVGAASRKAVALRNAYLGRVTEVTDDSRKRKPTRERCRLLQSFQSKGYILVEAFRFRALTDAD